MSNLKTTLDELKNIITDLKTSATSTTALSGSDLTNLEKRINHILNKSSPRHTNLTADLDIDLKDIENIDKSIGQEKIRTDAEIKKLTEEKSQLEKDKTAQQTLLDQKDKEIGAKITPDLLTKLENLTKDGVKVDETKLTEIKTIIEEIKNKGTKADLTDTNNKINELKEKIEKVQPTNPGTNYWTIGALIASSLSLLLTAYLALTRNNRNNQSMYQSKYYNKEDQENQETNE